jgi:hypothetical protein
MMKLPNKFQFRVKCLPGFTHTISKNAHGDYEVKWARGYPNKIREVPRAVLEECRVHSLVEVGAWIVVNDKQKQDELPDEFYFKHSHCPDDMHFTKRCGDFYMTTWNCGTEEQHTVSGVVDYVKKFGWWIIQDKKPLTAEQQRQLNDFKERIASLEQSIKLNEQDVEHKRRLISNYEATKADLLKKIEEMV